VARIITGDDEPPPWLVQTFEMWASSLATDRAIAVKQPTKAKTRKSLQAVTDAAHTLIDALNDGAVRGFLDEAPDEIAYHGQMDQMLCDLARRAGRKRRFARNRGWQDEAWPQQGYAASSLSPQKLLRRHDRRSMEFLSWEGTFPKEPRRRSGGAGFLERIRRDHECRASEKWVQGRCRRSRDKKLGE